jgi:hypothetical protein
MSSPSSNIEMQMMTTMVEIVEMDSKRVIMIRSDDVVKSLKILDMRAKRTIRNNEEKGSSSRKA